MEEKPLTNFSKIPISACHVIEAKLGAITIRSVDGGHIKDVVVENIRVESADTRVFLRLGARGRTFRAGVFSRAPGAIAGVSIRDLQVRQAQRIGILKAGIEGHTIQDVSLQRVAVTMVGRPAKQLRPEPGEAAASCPEVGCLGMVCPRTASMDATFTAYK